MKIIEILFWISVFAPIYTYLIYPVILKTFPFKCFYRDRDYIPTVSVVISAYNEEKDISNRIENLMKLNYPSGKIEFLIGSDGSTDKTNEIMEKYASKNEKIKFYPLSRRGKVGTLNYLLNQCKGEIIVFSDANTEFDENAVMRITDYFSDKRIGCVSGQVKLKTDLSSGEGAKSESTYWKYENIVKKSESKLGLLSGANGPIYAIRKELCQEIPEGIINDDFYVSTKILQDGYNVIMDTESVAYEKPNDEMKSQFKRHVRDGAGHYQAMKFFWRMLLPRKGSFVYISHRVIKWIVPFNIIFLLVSNVCLLNAGFIYIILEILQVIFYLAMLIYAFSKKNNKIMKVLSVFYYFLSVNLALLVGFYKYVTGKQKATWNTQR